MTASALGLPMSLRYEPDDVLVWTARTPRGEGSTAAAFFDALLRIEEDRRARGDLRQLRVLVDIRELRAVDAEVRSLAYRRYPEWKERRVAIVGQSRFQEFLVQFLVAATGGTGRYFRDEEAALAWLSEGIG